MEEVGVRMDFPASSFFEKSRGNEVDVNGWNSSFMERKRDDVPRLRV